ncbi:MAG: glutamine-synthetase adenylyltransferase [Pseudomonadota bacterium]
MVTQAPHHGPVPYDPSLGAEVAAAYPSELRRLVAGAAGTAPFLATVLKLDAAWLSEVMLNPSSGLAYLLSEVHADTADARRLRHAKRRLMALVALADLSGLWTLEEVTGALTAFAEATVGAVLRLTLAPALAAGRLSEDHGLTALGMGKFGAQELNYSSDIDIILLFDDRRHADPSAARGALVKVARSAVKLLSEHTPDGYLFRTDLRLRPDPSSTPLVQAVSLAERYYEALGRTWERAAFVKARTLSVEAQGVGERFIEALRPFVWRRHLDFAALRDIHDLRRKVRDFRGLITDPDDDLKGYDMKLAPGGIRDIEFFAQGHQLIHGGRAPELRLRGTVPALERLAHGGWIKPAAAETLGAVYRRHRTIEHRLQMLRDAQTHSLPSDGAGFDRLASLMGVERSALERQTRDDLAAVRDLCEPFFVPERSPRSAAAVAAESELAALLERWRTYPALRSPRAVEIFERLQPQIVERLQRASDPRKTLLHLDSFVAGLPAGVQLFSLFEARPDLMALLLDVAALSRSLAEYLGRNSGVLDAVLDAGFFAPLAGPDDLTTSLRAHMAALRDYEDALGEIRRWAKEQHFRIGAQLLRGHALPAQAGRAYGALADAVLAVIYPRVVEMFATKHGAPPGTGAVVVGMGSLGAGLLHAGSDLDLILIYDAPADVMSDGPKPLTARLYYARLTQALITALSAPLAQGKLYDVDMRLRPSGRNGPVATSLASFEAYQRDEAWTWEHLALTRARVVAGPEDLGARVEQVRRVELGRDRNIASVARDLAEMRARVFAARARSGPLDLKNGPGGQQDLELFAQAQALTRGNVDRATQAQLTDTTLRGVHADFWAVRAMLELIAPGADAPEALSAPALDLVASALGSDATELTKCIASHHAYVERVVSAWLREAGASPHGAE